MLSQSSQDQTQAMDEGTPPEKHMSTGAPLHNPSNCSALTNPACSWHFQLMKWAKLAVLLCPIHQLRDPGVSESIGQQQGLHSM